jgi:methylmalonyl-CoA mutase
MDKENLTFPEFDPVDYQTWLSVATKQLKGRDPEEALRWDSLFDLPLLSYYDVHHSKDTAYLVHFFARMESFSWKQLEPIVVDDVSRANEQAHTALSGGCDGILFYLNKAANLEVLTKGILFEHCFAGFYLSEGLSDLIPEIEQKRVDGFVVSEAGSHGFVQGRYDQNSVEGTVEMMQDFLRRPTANPVFYLITGQDFFHEMARIRGIRYLFSRVMEVMGMKAHPGNIHIHAEPVFCSEKDENWFTQVSAGLATIFGGAQSLSFRASDGFPRTSRNIGNLIRHESRIDTFRDVASGSYFIDYLTDRFIARVWEKFQSSL